MGAAVTAFAAGTAAAFAPNQGADSKEQRRSDNCQRQNIPNVHSSAPIPWITKVTTHAIRHCHRASPAAHLPPGSRRTEATAATQGVYSNKSFWEGHKPIFFDTLTDRHQYEMIAVFQTVVYTNSSDSFK